MSQGLVHSSEPGIRLEARESGEGSSLDCPGRHAGIQAMSMSQGLVHSSEPGIRLEARESGEGSSL
ncbi:hypothetical protein V5H41_29290, partial [Salmonella enterica]